MTAQTAPYQQNISGIHSAGSFVPTAVKSINRQGAILIALGIIALVGSLVATGCLYHNLGYTSFAFVGGGLAICSVYLLLAYYFGLATKPKISDSKQTISHIREVNHDFSDAKASMDNHLAGVSTSSPKDGQSYVGQKNKIINLKFNRLPCKHEGNSCFVNTALQTMAHLPYFRRLFDNNHNRLEKRINETEDSFKKRQIVQKKGNELINCILSGERADTLGDFITVINDALAAMGDSIRFNIHSGGSSFALLDYANAIVLSHSSQDAFMIRVSTDLGAIKECLEADRVEYRRCSSPQVLHFINFGKGDFAYLPEMVIDNVGTYRLEAITTSSSFGRCNSGLGHAVPIIRTDNGKYVTLDDLTGRVNEMNESALSDILSSNKLWQSAYYVRADKNMYYL
jgi:hypothetical protein